MTEAASATLALAVKIAELRAQLAEAQEQCVELAVNGGELHRAIEELQAENVRLRSDRDAWRAEARRRGAGAAALARDRTAGREARRSSLAVLPSTMPRRQRSTSSSSYSSSCGSYSPAAPSLHALKPPRMTVRLRSGIRAPSGRPLSSSRPHRRGARERRPTHQRRKRLLAAMDRWVWALDHSGPSFCRPPLYRPVGAEGFYRSLS